MAVMVEQNMKCEDDDVDSLDVFNQEDVFLDSLEPNTLREKCGTLVGSVYLFTALIYCLLYIADSKVVRISNI